MRAYSRLPLADRFWPRVRKTDTCWLWTGKSRYGYGQFLIHTSPPQTYRLAHRVSWELHNGPIPAGAVVCHRCDTPACVRPDHLFLGTQQDNVRDMREKGRGVAPPLHAGVHQHLAKLTDADVRAIRARYEAGEASQRALAREYGMARNPIRQIVKRLAWKHVH